MTDPITALLTRNLYEVFGEGDDTRRRAVIAEIFTEDCVFADPNGRHSGRAALNETVKALRAELPGFVFTETAATQSAGEAGRLAWGFGPPGEAPRVTGLDVIVVKEGRIAALYTFLDPPAA